MKHLFLVLALTFSVCVFSQATPVPVPDDPASAVAYEQPAATPDYVFQSPADIPETDINNPAKTLDGIFETFFALVAFIPIAVQFLRRLIIPNSAGMGAQIFSWTIGISITLAGWLLHLGFLDGLSIWLALLYAFGACLAANGIFDTGLITALFSLFSKKETIKL